MVAIFVQGQLWQFKGFPWSNPLSIFSHIKGFYLTFNDPTSMNTTESKNVEKWNVSVLKLHKVKRHHDVECVLEFWRLLDHWMTTNYHPHPR